MEDSKVEVTVSRYGLSTLITEYATLDAALADLEAREVHIDPKVEYVTAQVGSKHYVLLCDHCFEWEEVE